MSTYSDPLLGLSGTLWPLHLKPLPDELLSSWIIRLAHANGMKLQTFCSLVFGRDKSIWNRDIDKLAPNWLLTRLATATGTLPEVVSQTTLHTYEGVLYEHHQSKGNTRWILPLGIYHRTHHNPGLLCCPTCLAEDKSPYFRRSWRLALSVVCTKHGSWLIDRCPECSAPIEPHRADMQGKGVFPHADQLMFCWQCGHDLRRSRVECVADQPLLRFQEQFDLTLTQGYVDWAGNPSMHSLLFFDGIRALIAGVTSRQTMERLAGTKSLSKEVLSAWPHAGFDRASLTERRSFICWISKLLDGWPTNFQVHIQDAKLRYSDLKGDSLARPFWYESLILSEAGKGLSPVSEEEALSIIEAVEHQQGRLTLNAARNLSGRDLSNWAYKRVPVSDDVYEDLLTSIDHLIAGTFNKKGRACLIRDKIMFAAGRQLGLSESSLANLTIARLRVLAPERAKLNFFNAARTPAQARAWVEWYWNEMRPNLHPKPGSSYIFTSDRTRRKLSVSTIGARFNKMVDAAKLRAALPTFRRLTKNSIAR